MTKYATVGEVIAAFLEQCGVSLVFGVISIHNMPMLDAVSRRGTIRYVATRGEAGAVNMADGLARVRGALGVAFTSTGTAAGNAAGAMVEALSAGTPLLHLTGQIDSAWLERDMACIHEAPDQLTMLAAISKAAYRVRDAATALATVREAVRVARAAPTGPVSVEIPIDVQAAVVPWPADLAPAPSDTPPHDAARVAQLADALAQARRPLLWLGGGARGAGRAVARLADMGLGIVTSVQGRGIVPEDHPASLGAFNVQDAAEAFYRTCDAMLVVGSRLRGNETLGYALVLPQPLYRIDANPLADQRGYRNARFVHGDASVVLDALADHLQGRMTIAPSFAADLRAARAAAMDEVRRTLGPYGALVDALQQALGHSFNWVRDLTMSNSIWGDRLLQVFSPRAGVHAVGGGIGQGMPMAIGAALAGTAKRTVCLVGDGGFMLNLGELATAVQENARMLIILMNDRGYGVIRHIQDARHGGRRYYADLAQPGFARLCESFGLPYQRLASLDDAPRMLAAGLAHDGPSLLEVDMTAVGPFATRFTGPAARVSGHPTRASVGTQASP